MPKRAAMIIELGCGNNPITKETPDVQCKDISFCMDAMQETSADVIGITTHLPFKDNSVDGYVSQHVIEHHSHNFDVEYTPSGTLLKFLKEVYRTLKPGGFYETISPNLAYICSKYMESGINNARESMNLIRFLYGGQKNEYDFHYIGLDFNLIRVWCSYAGFDMEKVELLHDFYWFGLHVKMVK